VGGVRRDTTADQLPSAAAVVIEFREVAKTYTSPFGRPVRAVEGFSLRIEAGEVFGIAGPNGAGKSTLISLLLGYLRPTAGSVSIAGQAPRAYIESNGIGYLSELIAVPTKWTVAQALTRYALLAGVPDATLRSRVSEVIGRLGLEEHRTKRVRQLSKGTLQRLGLAQALLRVERIFILDEPTHGLDPVWTQRFRDLVLELRRPDRTMVITSHNLDELERVADRVAIIDRGRLQRVVDMRRSVADTMAATYHLMLVRGEEHLRHAFPDARELGDGEFELVGYDVAELNRGLGLLLARGAQVTALVPAYSALERQFREAIGERAT
jgi:ABC-2 type transport system ATP-binding protein